MGFFYKKLTKMEILTFKVSLHIKSAFNTSLKFNGLLKLSNFRETDPWSFLRTKIDFALLFINQKFLYRLAHRTIKSDGNVHFHRALTNMWCIFF